MSSSELRNAVAMEAWNPNHIGGDISNRRGVVPAAARASRCRAGTPTGRPCPAPFSPRPPRRRARRCTASAGTRRARRPARRVRPPAGPAAACRTRSPARTPRRGNVDSRTVWWLGRQLPTGGLARHSLRISAGSGEDQRLNATHCGASCRPACWTGSPVRTGQAVRRSALEAPVPGFALPHRPSESVSSFALRRRRSRCSHRRLPAPDDLRPGPPARMLLGRAR